MDHLDPDLPLDLFHDYAWLLLLLAAAMAPTLPEPEAHRRQDMHSVAGCRLPSRESSGCTNPRWISAETPPAGFCRLHEMNFFGILPPVCAIAHERSPYRKASSACRAEVGVELGVYCRRRKTGC
jgi:hypothetical protein